MPRGNGIQTLLIGVIILQTAMLLVRSWPTAPAEEAQTEEEDDEEDARLHTRALYEMGKRARCVGAGRRNKKGRGQLGGCACA